MRAYALYIVGWLSGLKRAPAKREWGNAPPRVQIPLLLPYLRSTNHQVYLYAIDEVQVEVGQQNMMIVVKSSGDLYILL